MLTIENELFVRVSQMENGPMPLPLASGFSIDTAYRTLGMFNPSETSDAYFILSNDRDEIWFISNRHLRTVMSCPNVTLLRLPLPTLMQHAAFNANIESSTQWKPTPMHLRPGR